MINIENEYSFILGLEKSIFRTLVVAAPILIGLMPEMWMNVTLGAVLTFLVNYAKNRNNASYFDTEEEQDILS